MLNFDFLEKALAIVFHNIFHNVLENKKKFATNLFASFSAWFLKKNIYLSIFYLLTKFNRLDAFTSRHIGQYAYCNCLLTLF